MEKEIKVLVVEDHTIVRQGIVSLINDEDGITVIGEAGDGREAITCCKKNNPDVVIMDIAMPRLNGLEAMEIIKKEFPQIKIIILSMYTEKEFILSAVDAGVSGYLIKSNAAGELIKAIREVNDGKAFFSPVISKVVLHSY